MSIILLAICSKMLIENYFISRLYENPHFNQAWYWWLWWYLKLGTRLVIKLNKGGHTKMGSIINPWGVPFSKVYWLVISLLDWVIKKLSSEKWRQVLLEKVLGIWFPSFFERNSSPPRCDLYSLSKVWWREKSFFKTCWLCSGTQGNIKNLKQC